MKKFLKKAFCYIYGYTLTSLNSFLFCSLEKKAKLGERIREFRNSHSWANRIAYTIGKIFFFMLVLYSFCFIEEINYGIYEIKSKTDDISSTVDDIKSTVNDIDFEVRHR